MGILTRLLSSLRTSSV
ncbi:hypothetical protein GJV14_16215 [Enterobacteriaceae bacterium RIT697]|nr:hypothetical protein [Enterobacteriaceae bacterium RIT697]MRT42797.1 hypothetical protein [Enterobacteriaceae bacterium RIT702]